MQRPLGWYIRRVRSMRPRELAHRVSELLTVRRLARAYRRGAADTAPLPDARSSAFCSSTVRRLAELPWRGPAPEQWSELLAGHWPALGYGWQWRNEPEVWHAAPDTQRRWPEDFFGTIPYLDGNPVGDVRVAWEPSRLQQLIAFALIARDADDVQAKAAIVLLEDQLLSWVEANPTLCGIHYISVMECAQRIMAACHALDMVRDRLTRPELVWPALLRLVQGHADLIARRMSLHSSTGNHTVTEAAGLIYAGTLFPELPGAGHWRSFGSSVLEREAANQILPDGGGVEQAFRYLLLVVDLLGLVTALHEHRGETPPPAIAAAFERGSRFLRAFASGYEDLPDIGDSDSGFALSRYLRLAWNGRSAGNGGNAQFDAVDPDVRRVAGQFEHSGYTLVTKTVANIPTRIVFDHGPFGMAPLYGHGHADMLALTLRVGDSDVLLDPGTYSYTGHPQWRRFFRSTRAHNTVLVDGQDQATQELSFMWSQVGRAWIERREGDVNGDLFVVAKHGGYRPRGVIHWRGVAFLASGSIVVLDHLAGASDHELELNWQCATAPARDGAWLRLDGAAAPVALRIDGGDISVHSQEQEPKRGWHAPVYGVRNPAWTVSVRHDGPLPHRFTTTIGVADSATDEAASRAGLQRLTAILDELL